MKVLLYQVDGKIPNLALRKYGGFFKEKGYDVFYDPHKCINPDLVKISCIFKWNAPIGKGIATMFSCPVELGGSGISGKVKLPEKVEHHMPDYKGMDFSMGFTSRGCIRNCDFCDVWRNEGLFREHASIEEFWDPKHNKVVFFDNIFNASKLMEKKLKFCHDHELKVSITQGVDARLINRNQAKIISRYFPYFNWKFNDVVLYTAWDRLNDEPLILRGIQNLISMGIPPRRIRVYMLVGFNTTIAEDQYRFDKLRTLGVYPFIMPYDNKPHPMKRWGQRPALFKKISYEKWHQIRVKMGRSY